MFAVTRLHLLESTDPKLFISKNPQIIEDLNFLQCSVCPFCIGKKNDEQKIEKKILPAYLSYFFKYVYKS